MKMELGRQGECAGPGQPHHEDAGRYVQGYNTQAVVTGGGQIIVRTRSRRKPVTSSNCTRWWNGCRRISKPSRIRRLSGPHWPMPAIAVRPT